MNDVCPAIRYIPVAISEINKIVLSFYVMPSVLNNFTIFVIPYTNYVTIKDNEPNNYSCYLHSATSCVSGKLEIRDKYYDRVDLLPLNIKH